VSQSVSQMNELASQVSEARGAFYSPPRESARWGVRDPDMSESRGADMSGNPYWNPTGEPDKSGSET
jgi:hypothetical protein